MERVYPSHGNEGAGDGVGRNRKQEVGGPAGKDSSASPPGTQRRAEEEGTRSRRIAPQLAAKPGGDPFRASRSRAGEEGSGGSQSAPGGLGCQKVCESRAALVGFDPGGQSRAAARGGQI